MAQISLFEHNEIGYKKLCGALKNNRCATINHATGTGKSFIALKYLHENRDKKYLYLAPTYPIIDQLKNSCYDIGITLEDINIDTMIYTNLLKQDMREIYAKYDGIIFDEYHRVGANETYKKVKELKELLENDSSDKKFIGLTATPIRYLDHERNMTEEIFDGVVASNISLAEAMAEDLLPIPTYVNSVMSCIGEVIRNERTINRLPETEKKKELQGKLKAIKERIEQNPTNMKHMIEPYINDKDGKYIVFCSNIAELDKYYEEIDKWFPQFKDVKKFKVHSRQDKLKNKKNLDDFNEQKEGMSVLLCVDVLNEGVHAKGVKGVFLLRKTQSPIIYFQQIGRALSFSGRKKQITIFDMQNNFGNHSAIDAVYEEYRQEIEKKIEQNPEREEEYRQKLEKFKIMDETKNILQELDNIHKEGEIYNTLSCIYEYDRLEKSINTISEESLKQQLVERLHVIKEEIDNIEIDISKEIAEYKDINSRILEKLDALKQEKRKVSAINYKFSCMRLYNMLKRHISNLPKSDIKDALLDELKEVGVAIQEWKANPNKEDDNSQKLNKELEEKLKGIQNKYKYVNQIYYTLTYLKKYKKLENRIVAMKNVKEQGQIKLELEAIKNIDINLQIPIERYQQINEEKLRSLDEIEKKIEYLRQVQTILTVRQKIESLERKIRKVLSVTDRNMLQDELLEVKEKVFKIDIDFKKPIEEYQKINNEIIKDINRITKDIRYAYYRNKCVLEWKSAEARITRMGDTNEKRKALEKLEAYKKRILGIRIISGMTVEQYIETNGNIEDKLKQFRRSITNEKIIETQIEAAIKTLEELENKNDIFKEENAKTAYAKIIRHAKRINNNQLEKLLNLDILLPDELSTSLEERQQLLGQYTSIYEKEKNEISDNIEEIINFIQDKKRGINIKSDSEEEQKIAEKYLMTIVELSEEQGSRLINVLKENNICLRSWEKVLLGEQIDEDEIDRIITEAKQYVDIERKLPEHLYVAINNILGKYDTKKYKLLLSILEQADIIEQEKKANGELERYNRVLQVVEQIADKIDMPSSELDDIIIEKMKNLSEKERIYVKKKYLVLKTQQFKSWIKDTENTDITEFCKKMRSITPEEIQHYRDIVGKDIELYATINGIMHFIEENDGKYPDKNSRDKQERRITQKIREFIDKGRLDEKFEQLETELKSPWCNMKVIINSIVPARFKECDIKRVMLNTVEFFQKNGRRPLSNSEDVEEVKLAQEYEKICIGLLAEGDLSILNKIFNSKKNLRNTIEAYVRNMQKGRD